MVDTIHPVDAVAGSPSYGGRMLRQVNAVAFGGATAARPLGGRSGVRPGTSVTTVTASSTTWTCGPLAGVADVETAAEAGLVTFALDAVATGAVTAASASFARQDLIYIQIDIPVEDGSAVPVVTRKYIAGTVASTDPALPVARAFAIARINVPISGGGSPTVTWIAPYAVAAGGIVPVASSAGYPVSPGVGNYVDDAALGVLLRWSGSAWVSRDLMNLQLDTANSIVRTITQMGMGKITGNGATVIGETVTFPVPFASVPVVTANFLGLRTAGAFNSSGLTQLPGATAQAQAPSPSSAVVDLYWPSTFGSGNEYYYSWIAIGVPA